MPPAIIDGIKWYFWKKIPSFYGISSEKLINKVQSEIKPKTELKVV